MGIGTILIGISLLIVVVVLVVMPLLDRKRPAVEPPSLRDGLELDHQATIRAIREIDFDYRTNKLTEDDYRVLRAEQVQHGAHILRELDQLTNAETDIDTEIEARVSVIRQSPDRCPNCGNQVKKDDQFCAHCGHSLQSATMPQVHQGPKA